MLGATIRTRKDKAEARKQGDVRGWFAKLPRGRPPKQSLVAATDSPAKRLIDEANATATKKSRTGEREQAKWNSEEKFPILKEAVSAHVKLLPELKTIVTECEQGGDMSGLSTLTKPTLRNLVRYYFDAKPKGLSGMNKDDLVAEVSQRIVVTATELAATELGNEMVVDDNNEMDITP